MIAPPADPVAAVTHPDPYPYYARLTAERPFYFDAELRAWVASGASAVTAVLESVSCRVRPAAEPVPAGLLGSPAGEIFRHLARMTDGAAHHARKQAVSNGLGWLDPSAIAAASETAAAALFDRLGLDAGFSRLADYQFQLSVEVLASLFGAPPRESAELARSTPDFAAALTPGASPAQVAKGKQAAEALLHVFEPQERLGVPPASPENLRDALGLEARRSGVPEAAAANAAGFFFQAYDATAGLFGNLLVALDAREDLRRDVGAAVSEGRIPRGVVDEVARLDPPIQNTRRFVAEPCEIAGFQVTPGDTILVVLAAANRNPSANSDPDRFDAHRGDRRAFSFGSGAHACPGQDLAASIAAAGVAELLRRGMDVALVTKTRTYRPSANARIPVFSSGITG
ncbi:MAG: cytochrome P450 [Acidobacteria bacterium]|nr:cytochrome P450 [Acidobacteriota bacterium]